MSSTYIPHIAWFGVVEVSWAERGRIQQGKLIAPPDSLLLHLDEKAFFKAFFSILQ